jgi:hypothetical protein
MPGQPDIRVRNNHVIKRRVVELPRVRSFNENPVVTPIPIDGKNHPAPSVGSRGHGIASKPCSGKGASCNDSARGFQKISSVLRVKSSFAPRILPAFWPLFDDCSSHGKTAVWRERAGFPENFGSGTQKKKENRLTRPLFKKSILDSNIFTGVKSSQLECLELGCLKLGYLELSCWTIFGCPLSFRVGPTLRPRESAQIPLLEVLRSRFE